MPVKHLRVCPEPCGKTRFAPCSPTCRAPNPNNWRTNLQAGAGTIKEQT